MTMFITRLHLAVTPLLCLTIAYANTFIDLAIEDFPVDSNATIMAFGYRPEACKSMVFDPTTNITCCYSDKAEDLCNLIEQSPSCRNPENAVVTVPTNKCQLLLIKIPESDQGSYNISSPNEALTNGRNVQITVTNSPNSPKDLPPYGTLTIMTAGAGFVVLGSVVGFFMANKNNDLVTVEVAEAEV